MDIELKDIDRDNWHDCVKLKTASTQRYFVFSNMYSLVESKFDPNLVPKGIIAEGRMVGFIMYGKYDGKYWISRLMIDKNHQGKGYGKAAIKKVIEILKEFEDCREIYIDYEPKNKTAETLYEHIGFKKTGMYSKGAVIACYYINRQEKEGKG